MDLRSKRHQLSILRKSIDAELDNRTIADDQELADLISEYKEKYTELYCLIDLMED